MQAFTMIQITVEDLRAMIRLAVTEAIGEKLSPSEQNNSGDYISREEAAAILRISLPTLRNYGRRGILKPRRIGRRVLYARQDIDAALAKGR